MDLIKHDEAILDYDACELLKAAFSKVGIYQIQFGLRQYSNNNQIHAHPYSNIDH